MISSHAFANTIQLYSESHARRLFKARHHEMDKMHILAHTLTDASPSSFKIVLKPRGCTVYAFTIRSDAQTTRAKETQGEWLLARRYSEFASFRAELLRLIRQWEGKLEQCTHKIQSREFELVSNSLRRPITPSFPRKHMRGDNAFIVQERRRGLREFVRKLLDAYADISVYLFNSPTSRQEAGAGQYLRDIHDRLETFLEVPAAQKELERRHTAAVLALEDVQLEKTQERGHPSRTCCICLDDYECADEESDLEAVLVEALARDEMVKLPCGHHYHEDCVIEWFNTSVTCPLCRKPAVKEGPSSVFNVSS